MALSGGIGTYSGHGRSGERSGAWKRCRITYLESSAWALPGRVVCNPASARLPKSVPTFSPNRASLIARGEISSQPYLVFNLD